MVLSTLFFQAWSKGRRKALPELDFPILQLDVLICPTYSAFAQVTVKPSDDANPFASEAPAPVTWMTSGTAIMRNVMLSRVLT